MRILNYIPCKTNSRRIPQKNVKLYCGKRLVDYSIDYANATSNETMVSTDDASIVSSFDVKYTHLRELTEADSKLTNLQVMQIIFQNEIYSNFDYICLLQPTHPLRSHILYEKMVNKISGKHFGEVLISSFSKTFKIHEKKSEMNLIEGGIYMLPLSFLNSGRLLTDRFWHMPIGESISFNIDGFEDEKKFISYLEAEESRVESA